MTLKELTRYLQMPVEKSKVYTCSGGCGVTVDKYGARCPACQQRFDNICNRYCAMHQRIRNKSFEEQRDAINKFRAGEIHE